MGCACRACVSRLHSPAHPPLVRTWQPHLHCRRPLCLSLRMRAGRRVEVEGGGAPTCRRARVWVNEARQGSGGRWQWHGADPAVYRELPLRRPRSWGQGLEEQRRCSQPAVGPTKEELCLLPPASTSSVRMLSDFSVAPQPSFRTRPMRQRGASHPAPREEISDCQPCPQCGPSSQAPEG